MQSKKLYELKLSGRQVLLRIQPPEGARRASLSEIQKELRRRDLPYRHETLFEIYRRASNEFEPLAVHEAKEYDVFLEVSEDAQQAFITVVPPDLGEDSLRPASIKKALEAAKVERGIRYDEIKRILAAGEAQQHVLIAQGKLRKQGVDGRIEFDEKAGQTVVLGENFADYRELNLINNVVSGDLIARITHPTRGEDGYNVHAKVLKARPGKKPKYKVGRNVRLSEDATELFAVRDGYVVRTGDKISVENILELDNVDGETGNIRFHGVVRVRGQVEDNYEVEADKGIDVAGTVGKALLKSKGDIRIKGGAFGASLESEGNVHARFLSDSKVKADGSVIVDEYVLHCEVIAKRTVKVTREPQGFIMGGRTRAGTEIWSPVVGSEVSEDRTVLEVGGGVNVRKRFDALQERIDADLDGFDKLRKNLLYLQHQRESEGPLEGRQKEMYDRTVQSGRGMCADLLKQAKLHHEMLGAIANPQEDIGCVMISHMAHPGTSVQVQTSRVNVKDAMESCAFMILAGGLKAMPYGAALKLHKQHQQRARQ